MSGFSENYFKEFEDIYRKRSTYGAKRDLRTHFGSGIIVTADKMKNKREVSEDKLRDGEVSAVTYKIGNYAIRESTMLYKNDDDTYYIQRIPASKEQVEDFKRQYGKRSILFIGVDICESMFKGYRKQRPIPFNFIYQMKDWKRKNS